MRLLARFWLNNRKTVGRGLARHCYCENCRIELGGRERGGFPLVWWSGEIHHPSSCLCRIIYAVICEYDYVRGNYNFIYLSMQIQSLEPDDEPLLPV